MNDVDCLTVTERCHIEKLRSQNNNVLLKSLFLRNDTYNERLSILRKKTIFRLFAAFSHLA